MGSKRRIAKDILPIITKNLKPDQYYVEPFVGGCNMIDKFNHPHKIGSDNNKYLIAMWKELQKGWIPPMEVTEEEYKNIKVDYKSNGNKYPDYLKGYVGFNCSFRSKWWGGYARANENANYVLRAYNNVTKQTPAILDVIFYDDTYETLPIPKESIIYCDPPYADTTKYHNDFDSEVFWQWCREKVLEGHKIFVSEYNAPDDFICIWEKEINNSMSNKSGSSKKATEKLFIHKSQK